MVSCLKRPPKTFLTSAFASSLALGFEFSFDFAANEGLELVIACLTAAFFDGRDRALACPLTVAI